MNFARARSLDPARSARRRNRSRRARARRGPAGGARPGSRMSSSAMRSTPALRRRSRILLRVFSPRIACDSTCEDERDRNRDRRPEPPGRAVLHDEARRARGMGLGVFLARAFAERWQGRLAIESVAGQGTRATLEIPHGDEVSASHERRREDDPRGRRRRRLSQPPCPRLRGARLRGAWSGVSRRPRSPRRDRQPRARGRRSAHAGRSGLDVGPRAQGDRPRHEYRRLDGLREHRDGARSGAHGGHPLPDQAGGRRRDPGRVRSSQEATDSAAEIEHETPSLARTEWEHIQRVLTDCGGNLSQAARLLGLHRRSLQRKLAKRPVTR